MLTPSQIQSNHVFVASLEDRPISEFWYLCDELTVIQAALLIVGVDPSSETGSHCEGWKQHEQPVGYVPAKSALCHAINAGRLQATVRHSAREHGFAEKLADIEASEAEYMTIKGSTLGDDERLSDWAGHSVWIFFPWCSKCA